MFSGSSSSQQESLYSSAQPRFTPSPDSAMRQQSLPTAYAPSSAPSRLPHPLHHLVSQHPLNPQRLQRLHRRTRDRWALQGGGRLHLHCRCHLWNRRRRPKRQRRFRCFRDGRRGLWPSLFWVRGRCRALRRGWLRFRRLRGRERRCGIWERLGRRCRRRRVERRLRRHGSVRRHLQRRLRMCREVKVGLKPRRRRRMRWSWRRRRRSRLMSKWCCLNVL
ncbi:hypothetical protein BC829DRAFT_251240 [Chytridium lagenaria]|nr:hypothetical protein BC829DRAFT_251240 [Chytridium lagenaria]